MANLQFVIGAEVVASDGAPAFEIDVTNITEGGTSYQIIRVEADRFLISSDSGIGPASRSNVLVEEFTRAP